MSRRDAEAEANQVPADAFATNERCLVTAGTLRRSRDARAPAGMGMVVSPDAKLSTFFQSGPMSVGRQTKRGDRGAANLATTD
jgi:hypothetical protein